MNSLVFFALSLLFAVCLCKPHKTNKQVYDALKNDPDRKALYIKKWANWLKRHKKSYEDPLERNLRFLCYAANRMEKEEFQNELKENRGNAVFHVGAFPYADLCPDELEKVSGGLLSDESDVADPMEELESSDHKFIPQATGTIDWSSRATAIRSQGSTMACWAFATVAAVEINWAMRHSTKYVLSIQETVDCSGAGTAARGGWPHLAISWYDDHGGLTRESYYPWTGRDGTCQQKSIVVPVWYDRRVDGESRMEYEVRVYGPMVVCLNSRVQAFKYYSHDILTTCSASEYTHAVVLVGYSQDGTLKYWILRNSWGTDWGEDGYMRLERLRGLCYIHAYRAALPRLSGTIRYGN